MVNFLLSLLVFLFGLAFGSFLNVVIFRFNTGTFLVSRSRCFSCGQILRARDLIPVVSFALTRGRCRYCGSSISWQYPIVELLTAVSFLLIFIRFGLSLYSLLYAACAALLVVITFYDLKHKIIPDELVYTFDFLALISVYLHFSSNYRLVTSDYLVAGSVFFLFFATLWFFSRGRWMGLGDGKLALGVGWLLGFSGGFSALILAFWLGALWGIFVLFSDPKKVTMKSEIPFAPFIILGMAIVFFFHFDILTLLIGR